MIDSRPPADPEAAPLASFPLEPVTPLRRLRRLFFGNPISSEHAEHTLLPKFLALPVFSSDAISSVAYATQQIVLALGAAGLYAAAHQAEYTKYTMIVTGLIVALLAIVVISYWQTIFGYPGGGGSYIVSKDNLTTKRFGALPGLIAAAALLIDYVLTVSVSIASGVQNLGGIPLPHGLHWLHFDYLVTWSLLFIGLLTLANLRGLKESGAMFAIFTYGFVVMCYIMIALGMLGPILGWKLHLGYVNQTWGAGQAAETFGLVVLMRAFAQGCSAMTGTEAVSNGIPAFKQPKSHNAAVTLVWMGIILGTLFLGISYLATKFHVVYDGGANTNAVIDQISGAVFGKDGAWAIGYYLTQFFTAAILVLAANTSYADFPRLASILARDRYLPKQFSNLGDKLVFNNGIWILGLLAAALIIAKNGSVDALIPLYAIGVFTAFTLSQSGMVVHWLRLKQEQKGWLVKACINGLGAFATFLVLLDIAVEKFKEGAWFVMVLVALLVIMFNKIHRHYLDVGEQLKMKYYQPSDAPLTNTVLVMVPTLHRGVMPALDFARSLSPDCRAIHIETDPEKTPLLKERWEKWGQDVPLVILNSPYRALISPIMQYLDAVQVERRNHLVTVVVPEFVPTKRWHGLLHGQAGLRLKLALLGRKDVIVANVRYWLQDLPMPPPADALAEEDMDLSVGHASDHHDSQGGH